MVKTNPMATKSRCSVKINTIHQVERKIRRGSRSNFVRVRLQNIDKSQKMGKPHLIHISSYIFNQE